MLDVKEVSEVSTCCDGLPYPRIYTGETHQFLTLIIVRVKIVKYPDPKSAVVVQAFLIS